MKSRICFAKKNLADWIQLVWLAASCPIIITCGPADINPCSAQQRWPLFFFALFFWATGQRLRQLYLIGSYGEDRENTQHSDWIPGVCGSHSWRQLWGSEAWQRKKHGCGGADGASISLCVIAARVRPETMFPWPKCGKCTKPTWQWSSFIFLLDSTPLSSVFLCSCWLWCPFFLICLAPHGF